MPCSDGGPSPGEERRMVQDRLDELTRLLCDAVFILDSEDLLDSELARWKRKHDVVDKKRREAEAREAEHDRIASQVVARIEEVLKDVDPLLVTQIKRKLRG